MEGESLYERGQNYERIDEWKKLRERAVEDAERLMSDIPGFEAMTLEEKIVALDTLMQEFSYDEAGNVRNENRYVVREIARRWEALRAQDAMEKKFAELGMVA